jgi:hypothetical protein
MIQQMLFPQGDEAPRKKPLVDEMNIDVANSSPVLCV